MGLQEGLALYKDGPSASMGSHGPSGWMGSEHGWTLGMDGPFKGPRNRGVLGTDRSSEWIGSHRPSGWKGTGHGLDCMALCHG